MYSFLCSKSPPASLSLPLQNKKQSRSSSAESARRVDCVHPRLSHSTFCTLLASVLLWSHNSRRSSEQLVDTCSGLNISHCQHFQCYSSLLTIIAQQYLATQHHTSASSSLDHLVDSPLRPTRSPLPPTRLSNRTPPLPSTWVLNR